MDYKKTALNLLGFVCIIAAVLIAIYLCVYFWPFMVGILVAILLERIINFFVKRAKISRKSVGTFMVILFYIIIAMIIYLIIFSLIREAISITAKLPDIYDDLKVRYNDIYYRLQSLMDRTPDTVAVSLYNVGLELLNKMLGIFTDLANSVVNFVMFIPQLMVYVIVTFLASLFIVTDRRAILKVANDILPNKLTRKATNVLMLSIKSLGSYLKAQFILICITFIQLFIAFVILKQPYPLTLALIVAVVDALPILGTGTVLIPWGIYAGITGDLGLGIGLLVVYAIILIIRQLIEPRIVSDKIGVHPFLTLLAMYVGFKLLGLIGMIVGPVILVIYKNVFTTMFEAGYFKRLFVYKGKNI